MKDSERVPIGCRNTKKSAPLLIGRSSRFRVVTQLWVPPLPSSQLCLSLSGSLPLTEHRDGDGEMR